MDKSRDPEYVEGIKQLLLFEKNNDIRNGLYDMTQTMMSYHSNRIEGSTLSEEDTWELYDKGILLNGEKARAQDITDAQGHFLMFDNMLEHINEPITEEMIKSWHRCLKAGSYIDNKRGFAIGEYKKLNNSIGGLIQTVNAEDVEEEMAGLLERYHIRSEFGHTMNTLALFHSGFEHIHPFQDGNGRVGRMLLFRQCMDAGLVPCIITEDMDKEYKKALKNMAVGMEAENELAELFIRASYNYYTTSRGFVEQYKKLK